MPYKNGPMDHWTQQVMKKVTRARSLVRESHELLARNDEIQLSAELRQIECTLVMVLEDSGLRPALPSTYLTPSLPPTGPRRGNRRDRGRFTRGHGNSTSRPQAAGESQAQACASSAIGIQIVPAGPTSTQNFRDSSIPTCVEDETIVIKPADSITTTPPPQGVLVDFAEDITVIEVLPGTVAAMEALQIVHSEPQGQAEVC